MIDNKFIWSDWLYKIKFNVKRRSCELRLNFSLYFGEKLWNSVNCIRCTKIKDLKYWAVQVRMGAQCLLDVTMSVKGTSSRGSKIDEPCTVYSTLWRDFEHNILYTKAESRSSWTSRPHWMKAIQSWWFASSHVVIALEWCGVDGSAGDRVNKDGSRNILWGVRVTMQTSRFE